MTKPISEGIGVGSQVRSETLDSNYNWYVSVILANDQVLVEGYATVLDIRTWVYAVEEGFMLELAL